MLRVALNQFVCSEEKWRMEGTISSLASTTLVGIIYIHIVCIEHTTIYVIYNIVHLYII